MNQDNNTKCHCMTFSKYGKVKNYEVEKSVFHVPIGSYRGEISTLI